MIALDLLGAAPTNVIRSSQDIYETNPVVPQKDAPAPTQAVSYYPEAPGFVEDPRKPDINRDFGMTRYVPQWDMTGIDAMVGAPHPDRPNWHAGGPEPCGRWLAGHSVIGAEAIVGDSVGTPDEVSAAKAAIAELKRTYEAAGSPADFKTLYDGVLADWADWDGVVESTKRAANNLYMIKSFADAKAIGKRAQDLSQRIARTAGLVPPASDPQLEPSRLDKLFGIPVWAWVLAGTAIVLVGGVYIAVPLLAAWLGRGEKR